MVEVLGLVALFLLKSGTCEAKTELVRDFRRSYIFYFVEICFEKNNKFDHFLLRIPKIREFCNAFSSLVS